MTTSSQGPGLAAQVLLAGASLLFVLLLLGLLEGALRLAGLGAEDASRTSRLKYQQIFLPLLEPAERADGTAILRTLDPRLPYQSILRDKPEGSLRIVFFGGSASAGLGFSPNVTIARHLERQLRAAAPDRTVEVLNLGIVALSSRQVRVLVDYAVRELEPDLLVVYSGNNEFLEIHAQKYADAHATLLTRLLDLMGRTHLYRLFARAAHGGPEVPSLADRDFSHDDLRLTQDRIVQDIELDPSERDAVIDSYEQNLDAIARTAQEHQVPLLLLSVASNWEWRGRSDLPADWLDDLVSADAGTRPERLAAAVDVLTGRLQGAQGLERHDRLFRRAVAHAELGDDERARDDYRAAMNDDPHLRRALDAMNGRVRAVAERYGAGYLDTVAVLEAHNADGIVGFDDFYDYVHFTPRGAVIVAGAVVGWLNDAGLLPEGVRVDPEAYVAERLARLEAPGDDPLEVYEWRGTGFGAERIHDRDLWKYDLLLRELDDRIEAEPGDARALVYRGNAEFFRVDGAAEAAADYRAALALEPDLVPARANLETLLRERPVSGGER